MNRESAIVIGGIGDGRDKPKMRPHENLDMWKKAVELSLLIYNLTQKFPNSELYGLTSQLRRAAVSVPANIAEGAARQTKTEFKQFLFIARGSLSELATELHIAAKLGYITIETAQAPEKLCDDIGAMLTAMIKKLS